MAYGIYLYFNKVKWNLKNYLEIINSIKLTISLLQFRQTLTTKLNQIILVYHIFTYLKGGSNEIS